VVKDGVVKGGIFDAQTGNPWCHKDCSRFHPTEVQKMVRVSYTFVIICLIYAHPTYHMVILDDDFVIKIAAMRAGVADVEFTASKQKYKIAKIEKNNTLLFAFGQKGPLVLTITEGEKCIVVGFGDEKSETGAMTAAVGKSFSFVAHIRNSYGPFECDSDKKHN